MKRYRIAHAIAGLLLGVVLSLQSVSAQTTQPLEYHRFRFFINPSLAQGLSSTELKRRLSLYVEDLNTIFAKQTIRRFNFNPETDITFTQTEPQTNHIGGQPPATGFEIWASVQPSESPDTNGSYGGNMSFDDSGAGVAAGLRWDVIRDREVVKTLPAGSWDVQEYWDQIDHMTHEIEHMFGCGSGEYYNLRSMPDRTGILPTQNIEYYGTYDEADTATNDPYWSQHSDYWRDPLLIWHPHLTYAQLMDGVRFANVTTAVINARIRPAYPDDYKAMLPDLSRTRIWSLGQGQRPLANSRVVAWKVQKYAASDIVLFDGYTNADGYIEFPWSGDFNNYDFALLIKVFPPNGGTPTTKWYSIFDAQEQKMVYGKNQLDIPVAVSYSAAPPTLTSVTTLQGVEDTALSVSYEALAAAADEYDPNGLPISFRFESLRSGALTKNGVATVPGSTFLAPGEVWVWKPAKNANGAAIGAFTIRGFNGVEYTASAVPVTVDVAPQNDPPIANAGADQTLALAGTATAVKLDGSGSYDVDSGTLTYEWREGATLLATGVSPTVNLSSGVHTIVLQVTDSGGALAQDSVVITVQAPITSTPNSALSGSGTLAATGTATAPTWNFSVTNDRKGLRGSINYTDRNAGKTVQSTKITALVVSGKQARVYGKATINGTGSYDFVLDASDLARRGAGTDTFSLRLSDGSSFGGTIKSGDILVQ
ncbi:MAG TPA: post-COAP-1 domain-containing protein [Abditibacteriaceae bacterium]|jgi:hypothetical protein